MEAQPYMIHRIPALMGMTNAKWDDFQDLLVIANDMQLEEMEKQIANEKARRIK